ncbi:hypothetical protein ACQCX2_07725 [Propionibacteriaceae bacterium Y1700]|uniref:hypothetical protein n=1 Tax=Microlunatus sp. Y1700 TaxID=3418487 RepID=UPI003DA6D467
MITIENESVTAVLSPGGIVCTILSAYFDCTEQAEWHGTTLCCTASSGRACHSCRGAIRAHRGWVECIHCGTRGAADDFTWERLT